MTPFLEMPGLFQSGVLMMCTLLAMAEIYCIIVCRLFHAESGELFLNILLFLICAFYLMVFAEGYLYFSSGTKISSFSEAVCRLPCALTCMIILLLVFASCACVRRVNVWRRTNVTPMSIKQGTDKLPTGICCCDSDGKPKLTNHCMERLCKKITGEPLFNAKVFWQKLTEGDVVRGNTVIKTGSEPIIRLDTGEVRSFSRREISGKKKTFEITAADITEQYRLSSRLIASNAELEQIKNRLLLFSENVSDITREKEVLAAKISIHNKLGTALLASKRYIQENSSLDRETLLKIWQSSILFLEREAKQPSDGGTLDGLYDAARIMGLTLCVEGELPREDNRTVRLIMSGARECITNAVDHAAAKKLFIRISSDRDYDTVEYTNDGIVPAGKITEGGGLSSLRREVEEKGGLMQIDWEPQFVLRLKIPKIGGSERV